MSIVDALSVPGGTYHMKVEKLEFMGRLTG